MRIAKITTPKGGPGAFGSPLRLSLSLETAHQLGVPEPLDAETRSVKSVVALERRF